MKSNRYLLLLDPHEDFLSFQETALQSFYSGDVCTFTNAENALAKIGHAGDPELMIVDSAFVKNSGSDFYKLLLESGGRIPVIATTLGPLSKAEHTSLPPLAAIIEKPVTTTSFTNLIKGISQVETKTPAYVPVKVSILSKMGLTLFDLFIRLSDSHFVKIIHKGEVFQTTDAEKLLLKNVSELYIKYDDCGGFLSYLESELARTVRVTSDNVPLSIERIETFERVARYLKWTPEVLASAQNAVGQAVKILSRNPKVVSVIKKRLSEPSSPYSRHIGLLTYLVAAIGSSLDWIGESGQVKLALAALIHDAAVDDEAYTQIECWNMKGEDLSEKTTETIKYRMHPFEGAKLVKLLDTISHDVEQIILQHHEKKDGKGFPRGLDHSRIGHLPALFIMVEDLLEFIGDGENIETSVTDFIMWGDSYYDAGHFKKIFAAFKKSIKE